VRAKAAIAWNSKTNEIRAGQFDVPPGFEHWILKFDGLGDNHELGTGADYGRIEYAYHLMAVAAGITMAPCRLLEENGRAHFDVSIAKTTGAIIFNPSARWRIWTSGRRRLMT
jgi:serine/threonine-protein kinase HipA